MGGVLYVVATPIGNLEDITYRAVRILNEASLAAAEDTRHSRQLFTHFGIKTPLHSCHKFNELSKLEFFLNALRQGSNIALISDAGTPCISDPGFRLVNAAAEAGFTVTPVCGACAAVAALSISGFDGSVFSFIGFPPRTAKQRAAAFGGVRNGVPVVFYESPRRVRATLETLAGLHPGASVCLCNDLTKKFERIYRGTPAEVLNELADNPNAEKGEYVGVVWLDGANDGETSDTAAPVEDISLEARLVDLMIKENVTLKEAVSRLGGNRNAAYAASLNLKKLF
jgi:16S rRNA (cytidine1402-2'-O)-methyltransferase